MDSHTGMEAVNPVDLKLKKQSVMEAMMFYSEAFEELPCDRERAMKLAKLCIELYR